MEFILAVDIGTSSTKGIAFAPSGEVLASHSLPYAPLPGPAGHHELDPEALLQASVTVIREVLRRVEGGKEALLGISFSCAMHSLLAVDSGGKPLTPVITWADLRSQQYAALLRDTPLGRRIYEHTGTPIHPMSPLCKIAWLKEQEPRIFSSAAKFISIKEYIFYRLFGGYWVDYSIASATGLFDIYTLRWYPEALEAAGISAERLSTPVSTTTMIKGLTKTYADRLGTDTRVPFFIGASDGCLANLGSDAVYPGDVSLTIGTSGAVRMVSRQPQHDAKERIFNYILTEDLYVSGGPINNGGVLLKWYGERVLGLSPEEAGDYGAFIRKALEAPPGCDGLIFLPYIRGERAPVWDADARGVFFGIHDRHTQSHFMRAILEGIGFSLFEVLTALEETIGPATKIYASGGFTHSVEWLQLMADLLGKPLQVTDAADASAIGAAILGLKAIGKLEDLKAVSHFIKVREQFEPDRAHHLACHRNYEVYTMLYDSLKTVFKKQS